MNAGQVTSSTEVAPAATPETDDDMLMYVQLRPRLAVQEKCLAALHNLAKKHPTVRFGLAGLSKDARYLHLTLAVNLGPATQIAKNANNGNAIAQAAYLFVSALFTELFDYLPQYTGEPSTEQQAAAAAITLNSGRPAAETRATESALVTA